MMHHQCLIKNKTKKSISTSKIKYKDESAKINKQTNDCNRVFNVFQKDKQCKKNLEMTIQTRKKKPKTNTIKNIENRREPNFRV